MRPARLAPLLAALVVALALVVVPGTAQAAPLPSKATWEADVATVMKGSVKRLRARVADAGRGEKLAINLDIDNTSLATTYERYAAVAPTLRLARAAQRHGVKVFFNTGRLTENLPRATQLLLDAGFPVDDVCGREEDETLRESKPRCRQEFRDAGYTLVANIGNNPTDFRGGGYERAYRLPSYGGRLS